MTLLLKLEGINALIDEICLFNIYCFKVKSANGKGIPIINKLNIIQDFSGKHQVCPETYVGFPQFRRYIQTV